MKRAYFMAAALCASGAAGAQNVTLACSSSQNGPPQFQIEIDFSRSTVSYPRAGTPAKIENNRITWEQPRRESAGSVQVAARYDLNRVTGVLSGENLCLPRDFSWCNPGGSVSYCKPAARQF